MIDLQQFGTLDAELMSRPLDSLNNPNFLGSGLKLRANSGVFAGMIGASPSSPLARRTKHEIKNSQKFAKKYAETPMLWAKCLLSTCFRFVFIVTFCFSPEKSKKVNCFLLISAAFGSCIFPVTFWSRVPKSEPCEQPTTFSWPCRNSDYFQPMR